MFVCSGPVINEMLMCLLHSRGGITALRKWCGVWNGGMVSPYTTELWTGGLVTPLDEGPKEETITGRKIRPIILCECLVKFAEGVDIETDWDQISKYMEAHANLGVGTPDGNVVLLKVLQSWVEEMEIDNTAAWISDKLEEIRALVGIDLQNAYGEFYRSGAIREVMERLPSLMGLVKSELQNGENVYWQKVDGTWMKKKNVERRLPR